ncbi:hypothetical protein F4810DRAFT_691928 [Camillea tinctor]|nr:hypothetical protein F4810DRAFT_691928 [Camillea tinctor]
MLLFVTTLLAFHLRPFPPVGPQALPSSKSLAAAASFFLTSIKGEDCRVRIGKALWFKFRAEGYLVSTCECLLAARVVRVASHFCKLLPVNPQFR